MNKGFYTKMAWGNIRKNHHIYLPYFLAAGLVVGLYYIFTSLRIMVRGSEMKGYRTMLSLLSVCTPIAGLFALVILFYVNSFIMKQRKRELGVYNILGMEKRHLARLMVTEVLMMALASLTVGILGGALFSQLVFLLFYNLVRINVQLTFTIPFDAVGETVTLFGIGFLFVMVYDVVSVLKTNPIRLLQESRQGEREPKASWFLVLVGVSALSGGYWLAQSVKTPMEALRIFFIAVLLVIVGTYCLFISGSIAFLKFLKRREHFYYKPSNFISVSGMIYRMKQNAVGLASICILSTTVMATVGSSLSMFVGLEDAVDDEYVRDFYISSSVSEKKDPGDPELEELKEIVERTAENYAGKHDLKVENVLSYLCFTKVLYPTDAGWESEFGSYDDSKYRDELVIFHMMAADDFEKNTGIDLSLEKGEAAFWESSQGLMSDTFTYEDLSFKLHKIDQSIETSVLLGNTIQNKVQLILPSANDLESLQKAFSKVYREEYGWDEYASLPMSYYYFFDLSGDEDNKTAYRENMREGFDDVPNLAAAYNRDDVMEDYYKEYGTVLFVGLFLALMFLVATVLIIYYKQVTEGYEDRKRFQIMQKVGLSSREVRKTIQKQVLLVFFLPLLTAVIHMLMAFKSIVAMLSLFAVYNKPLYAMCIGCTVVVFGVFYFLVYEITAKTYYKIVVTDRRES